MIKVSLIILFIYLATCLLLYIKQRDLLYFPTPESGSSFAQALWIDSHSHRLKLWQIHQKKPAIIYFGGNAESVENNIPDFDRLFPDHSVYLVNYRGYGGSSGSPSEPALFEDALAVYDELNKTHAEISVIGRSLGSGVAVYLSTQRKVERLALITPYDSIKNVAKSHYPFFPVNWLIKDSFDSLSRSNELNLPILVLIADHDDVVPRKHSEQLIQGLKPDQVEFRVLKGSNHGDISSHPEYFSQLSHFLR